MIIIKVVVDTVYCILPAFVLFNHYLPNRKESDTLFIHPNARFCTRIGLLNHQKQTVQLTIDLLNHQNHIQPLKIDVSNG